MFIELRNVSKYYGSLLAVNRLSMTVPEGDIYGFLGPNGSGKSTTIRMILSLIRPTSGEILLFGKEISRQRHFALRRIGALVEKPDFYNYLTARKNLQILGRLSEVPQLNRRVDEVLDIVGLLPRAASRVHTYSQGMKQRLGIAQAILHHPDLIILDEPTNGLDPQGQKEIRELILSLQTDHHITILISSHLLFEMEQIATRMIILHKGKSLVEGTVTSLLNNREQQVSVEIDRPKEVIQKIHHSEWAGRLITVPEHELCFKLARKEIPRLNHWLIRQGFNVFAIEPVRSLESFFLQITDHDQIDPD